MKITMTLVLMGILALTLSCSTIRASYDYDPEVDFSLKVTYDWLPMGKAAPDRELIVKRVKSEVTQQLAQKGVTRSEDNPDFLIAVHGGKQTKLSVEDWGYSYGRDRSGGYRPYRGGRVIDVYQYEEGTLILDFVDSGSKELIWRGSATGIMAPHPTPSQRGRKVQEAVTKILENFPPGP
jgi:hypothetical protein